MPNNWTQAPARKPDYIISNPQVFAATVKVGWLVRWHSWKANEATPVLTPPQLHYDNRWVEFQGAARGGSGRHTYNLTPLHARQEYYWEVWKPQTKCICGVDHG